MAAPWPPTSEQRTAVSNLSSDATISEGIRSSVQRYYGEEAQLRSPLLVALCSKFASTGDVVLDVGAHVGDRVAAFRTLGARVIAIEPQPLCADALRRIFVDDAEVIVVEAACGAEERPSTVLLVNSTNPTVTSLSLDFVRAATGAPGWEGQSWDCQQDCTQTTLDAVIRKHGKPAFIKIDVEGFEASVLQGLRSAVPALSFEFTTIQRGEVDNCLSILESLGPYRFNAALGETHEFVFGEWINGPAVRNWVTDLPQDANAGDIYAVLPDHPVLAPVPTTAAAAPGADVLVTARRLVEEVIATQSAPFTLASHQKVSGMATPGLIKAFPDLDPKVVAKHARKACFTLLVEQGLTARPITFFSGSPLSDDLEMEQPSWRRYLSNFAVLPEPLTCWGGRYPTVEHAFHAAKYLRCAQPTDLATKAAADFECEGVLGDADGKRVKQAGGRKGMSERGCSLDLGRWDGGESEEVTQQLLELRWTIDPTFRSILHETARQGITLVHFERGGAESFWGGGVREGGAVVGRNRLGEMLMELRTRPD